MWKCYNELEEILLQNIEFDDFLLEYEFPVIGHKKCFINTRLIFQENREPQLILLSIKDITSRKQMQPECIYTSTGRAWMTCKP